MIYPEAGYRYPTFYQRPWCINFIWIRTRVFETPNTRTKHNTESPYLSNQTDHTLGCHRFPSCRISATVASDLLTRTLDHIWLSLSLEHYCCTLERTQRRLFLLALWSQVFHMSPPALRKEAKSVTKAQFWYWLFRRWALDSLRPRGRGSALRRSWTYLPCWFQYEFP